MEKESILMANFIIQMRSSGQSAEYLFNRFENTVHSLNKSDAPVQIKYKRFVELMKMPDEILRNIR